MNASFVAGVVCGIPIGLLLTTGVVILSHWLMAKTVRSLVTVEATNDPPK